jgi:hypothetical protein
VLILSQKFVQQKNVTVKIDSPASVGSHGGTGNILASLGLRWWQPMIVIGLHEHCRAAEVTISKKAILVSRVQLCPSDLTVPFKLCRRQFAIKIAFAVTISKAQG